MERNTPNGWLTDQHHYTEDTIVFHEHQPEVNEQSIYSERVLLDLPSIRLRVNQSVTG